MSEQQSVPDTRKKPPLVEVKEEANNINEIP